MPDMFFFRDGETYFPLRAALSFDRLHLCGASSSARKSERIYELGRLRLTPRGEVPNKKHTHTQHTHTHTDELKIANVKEHGFFKHIFPMVFIRKKVDICPGFWHVSF